MERALDAKGVADRVWDGSRGVWRKPPPPPWEREHLQMEDLLIALRSIARADVTTPIAVEMRRIAFDGLRAAERWGPLPEVP